MVHLNFRLQVASFILPHRVTWHLALPFRLSRQPGAGHTEARHVRS
jgi:hypothetical protein